MASDKTEGLGPVGGRRAGVRRWAGVHSAAAVAFALAFAVLFNLLVARVHIVREQGFTSVRSVSARTREILAHAQGPVRVTCFFDRNHPLCRPATRLMRGFQAVAAESGGASITIVSVNPRTDLAAAAGLAAASVPPNALVFEGRGRRLVVPAAEMTATNGAGRVIFRGETVCAAAVASLARADQPALYWLTGHGEGDFTDYDPQNGFTSIAREIRHEGYDLRPLDLRMAKGIPGNTEALIVAAPRRRLAAEELAWIDAYLTRGGRLLYLANPSAPSGLEETLERWGVRVTAWKAVSRETRAGQDTVILHYGDHPIARGLTNAATVFLGSRCIQAADSADASGADHSRFTPLALTGADGWGTRATDTPPPAFDPRDDLPGPVAVAAAVERGGAAAKDITLQPTRLVVFGEQTFVDNAVCATRSSANRDLLINALNWLTGIDGGTGPSDGADAAFWAGLDRRGWMRLTIFTVGVAPGFVLLVGALIVARRRGVRA